MRSAIKKQLFKTFRQELDQQYPSFVLTEVEADCVGVWSRRLVPQLYIFFEVMQFPNEDTFVAELAWSDQSLFPWDCDNRDLNFDLPAWWDRMGRLWKKGGMEPVWELAPEDRLDLEAASRARRRNEIHQYSESPSVETVVPRIQPCVEKCLKKFQKYGVPVFNKLANHRGLGDVL